MDSDSQTTSPIESSHASDTKEENTKSENSESAEKSNVIDVIGNGQLVKKVM